MIRCIFAPDFNVEFITPVGRRQHGQIAIKLGERVHTKYGYY